jgi:hypothetical protein
LPNAERENDFGMRAANRLALSLARAMSTGIKRASGFTSWAGARMSRDLGFGGPGSGLSPDPEADAVAERPQRRLAWTSRLLLVAALAVPLLLLAIAAWQNFRLVQLEAKQRVTIETGQLHEHALSAIETYALILAWSDDRTAASTVTVSSVTGNSIAFCRTSKPCRKSARSW